MMICIGGVCVPLNLLIPFLVGLLHRYGYLQWFKQEWVTISYWKKQYARWSGNTSTAGGQSQSHRSEESSRERQQDSALREDNQAVKQAVDSTMKRRQPS